MQISAIQQFSILDYPEKTSCIIFTPGCNFRCGYCHNPEFVIPEQIKKIKDSFIDEAIILKFLDSRIGLLDGVVITGGEPTIHHDLKLFIKKIKERGFLVKLDTNGSNPVFLDNLITDGLIDYVAMDVKTSLKEYPALVGKIVQPSQIAKSIDILKQGKVDYEFRSTLIKECHSETVLNEMAELLSGAYKLYLQQFRPGITLSSRFATFHSFTENEMKVISQQFMKFVEIVQIRS